MQRILVTAPYKKSEKKVESTEESLIKKLGISLPQVSVAIIVLSLIKQTYYYVNYKVPIKYFIGISELGVLITQELLAIGFVILITSIVMLILFLPFDYLLKNKSSDKAIKDTGTDEVPRSNRLKTTTIVVISLVIISIAVKIFLSDRYDENVTLFGMIIFCSFFIVSLLSDKFSSLLNQKNIVLLTTFVVLLYVVFVYIGFEIRQVDKGRYKGTIINTEKKDYVSTDSSFFIGKTDKWIFIYNKKDSTTSIIPVEEVTGITLKSKY